MHLYVVLGALAALVNSNAGTPINQPFSLEPNLQNVEEIRKSFMYAYPKVHLKREITNENPQIQIQLNFYITFFGQKFNYTWVSLHGRMQFGHGDYANNYPLIFPNVEWPYILDPAFIAPFYANALIGRGDNAIAEETTPPGVYFKAYENIGASKVQAEIDLQEAVRLDVQQGIIGVTDFKPKHLITVTWKNITFGGSSNPRKTNTYQLMIATDERRSYAIFNYQNVTWTTSTAASGNNDGVGGTPAYVGFNAGNGTRAFEYKPFSQTNRVLQLVNMGHINGHPGRHIFRIDQLIQQGICNFETDTSSTELSISPESGHMLGGTMVNITGPCFEATQSIKARFHNQVVTCVYQDRQRAVCITPPIYAAGFVNVEAKVGDGLFLYKTKFYVENPHLGPEYVRLDNPDRVNSMKVEGFDLNWDYRSTNWLQNKPALISLWGYKEVGNKPRLEFIRLLKEETNLGKTTINVADYENADDGIKTDYTVGLIQVNGTTTLTESGISLVSVLWSRPMSLGWYFEGQWKRQLGSNWPQTKCQNWIQKDDVNYRIKGASLPTCPCTLTQAKYDKTQFIPDPYCHELGECDGDLRISLRVISAKVTKEGYGQQCCYDHFDENLLIPFSTNEVFGYSWRSHPFGQFPYNSAGKIPGLSHWLQDLQGYYSCCKWSNGNDTCHQFMKRRPTDDCTGYKRNNVSQVYGDPHFLTNDNFNYTFNGQGEFSLVNVHNENHHLDVQARFQPYVDIQKSIQRPATILTAIVAKENTSETVQIQYQRTTEGEKYKLDVLVNSKRIYLDNPGMQFQQFKGVTVHMPYHIKDQSDVIVAFESGAGVQVINKFGYIAARVYLPQSFKNQTRGLMGTWSNDKADDLVTPNGHIVMPPKPDSLQVIHTEFGLQWMLNLFSNNAALLPHFYYENHRSSSSYNNKTFRPIFEKNLSILPTSSLDEEEVLKTCSGFSAYIRVSKQCCYDYIVTEDKNLATSTLRFEEEFYDQFFNTRDVDLCPALKPQSNMQFSTIERHLGTLVKIQCAKGYALLGFRRTRCLPTMQWSSPIDEKETRCAKMEEDETTQNTPVLN